MILTGEKGVEKMTKKELLNILSPVEDDTEIDFSVKTEYGYEYSAEVDFVKSELAGGTVKSILVLYRTEKEASDEQLARPKEIAA